MRTPETVNISLHALMQLLNFRWAAANSSQIGELGLLTHEELCREIDRVSNIQIKPAHLADLVYHMREAVFERLPVPKMEPTIQNHNVIMKRLRADAPHLFKRTDTGEIVMVELEDKSFE